MLLERSHDPQGEQRIIAWLRVRLADNVAPSQTEMIIFVYFIYLVICRVTTQQERYDVRVFDFDVGRHS